MNLSIQIKVNGSEEVRRKMVKLGSSLYDFSGAMDKIGKAGSKYFQGPAWLSQGGVFGNKWAELSTDYAGRKAKTYPGRGPLVKTGGMQKSFYHKSSKSSVIIGNKASQFKYHQSTLPRRKIPRRQMIGASDGFKKIVRDIMKEDIKNKIRSA